MAWSYSGDPSTSDLDLVRFLCGDTEEDMPLLTNEEITYLLSTKGSPQKAAQSCCERILAKLAREVDYTIGPERVEASQRLANYKELLKTLKADTIEATAAPIWKPSSPGAGFRVGMHDPYGGDYCG